MIGSGPAEYHVERPAAADVAGAMPEVVEQIAAGDAVLLDRVGQDRQPVERLLGLDGGGDIPGRIGEVNRPAVGLDEPAAEEVR